MLKHRSGSQKKKDSALEVNFFCHFPSNNWSCPFFTVDPTLSTEKCREFIFNTLIYTNADLYINIYNYKYIYNYIYIHIYINFKSYVLRRCSSRINSIDTIALKHRLYWERKREKVREKERAKEILRKCEIWSRWKGIHSLYTLHSSQFEKQTKPWMPQKAWNVDVLTIVIIPLHIIHK